MNAIPLVLALGATISPKSMDPLLKRKPIQGDVVTWITTNKAGFPFVPIVSEFTANKTSIGFQNNSETTQSL